MKQFKDFKSERSSTGRETLPAGGYVCQILSAKVEENDWGSTLVIAHDVCEGDYNGIFKRDYDQNTMENKKWRGTFRLKLPKDDGSEQDAWKKRSFNNFIWAVEQSNSGYHFDWDETKMKGLIVGGLFVLREYEGQNGDIRQGTTLASWTTADTVRNNKFKLPKDKLLKREESSSSSGFTPVTDDDLPF